MRGRGSGSEASRIYCQLCWGGRKAKRGLFGLALWIFLRGAGGNSQGERDAYGPAGADGIARRTVVGGCVDGASGGIEGGAELVLAPARFRERASSLRRGCARVCHVRA